MNTTGQRAEHDGTSRATPSSPRPTPLRGVAADSAYIASLLSPAGSPVISVPTITLEGDANGAPHPEPGAYAAKFAGKYTHRTISGGVGHNLPQEAPQAFAQAIIDVADQR